MNLFNQFLAEMPKETRLVLYGRFGTIMHVVMFAVLLLLMLRRFQNKKNVFRLLFSFYVAFYAGNMACNVLGNLTHNLIPKINLGVAFFFFLLVSTFLLWLLKAPVRQSLDIAVPVFILGRGVGIIGCLFPGCCHGFPAAWGIYSNHAGTTVVPTVLFDILLSFVIVVYLLLSKKKLLTPGAIAARGILLFGVLRYVVDVLRDNNKLFLMVTTEGICGMIYVLIGLFLLYLIENNKLQEHLVKAEDNLDSI